jgi:hypothetical protein
MASGYWQLEIEEEDKPKTAFITKFGLFEHNRMAFGLCNAPATFQRAIQLVLADLLWRKALAYIDDVIVLGTILRITSRASRRFWTDSGSTTLNSNPGNAIYSNGNWSSWATSSHKMESPSLRPRLKRWSNGQLPEQSWSYNHSWAS